MDELTLEVVTDESGHTYVEASVNGQPLRVLVDRAIAERLGHDPSPETSDELPGELLPLWLVAPPSKHWLGAPHAGRSGPCRRGAVRWLR